MYSLRSVLANEGSVSVRIQINKSLDCLDFTIYPNGLNREIPAIEGKDSTDIYSERYLTLCETESCFLFWVSFD